jgi:carbamoyltransferase
MIIYGINDSSHDSALSVLVDGKIVFAAHSERYSGIKNDWSLNEKIFNEALQFGSPDIVSYYENRKLKLLRKSIFGGFNGSYNSLYKNIIDLNVKEIQFNHHYSHAAAGYFTSSFEDTAIVVIDAIGEFDTSSIWVGEGNKIKIKQKIKYPNSFGLFYSAFTQLLGLVPGKEEYILMGMAAFGKKTKVFEYINSIFYSYDRQKYNFHRGIKNFPFKIENDQDRFDVAWAVQKVYELRFVELMHHAKQITKKNNLVFMGGCALNCSANHLIKDMWDKIWIMPNPGDAGSSLGAALAVHGKHTLWEGPYLGTNIPGKYPVDKLFNSLKDKKIAAVASGRAEFGPRALGNRSILADPRDSEIKQQVNKIKQREQFRPFAPVVLEEHAEEWFEIKDPSPYMQYAVKCKKPDLIPSVVHYDGTSRVQTVNRSQHEGLYDLLVKWKNYTGIPVLLNTSLNIKNQPLLNSVDQIDIWKIENPDCDIH